MQQVKTFINMETKFSSQICNTLDENRRTTGGLIMRKIFEAIGKVTTRLMAVVIGICIARFLPLWLGGIIAVCAFVILVITQMEE